MRRYLEVRLTEGIERCWRLFALTEAIASPHSHQRDIEAIEA
jgi:hypothetical protein